MATTANPPFTGSYGTTLQGINVSTYNIFGGSISPKLGRSGDAIFQVTGSSYVNVSPSQAIEFNDSVRRMSRVSRLVGSGSNVEIISDDTFRMETFPEFLLSRQTYGQGNSNVVTSSAFTDIPKFDPTKYVRDPESVTYPFVIESDTNIDINDMNGVIEPIAIRAVISNTSTFIGNLENPEPTGFRGQLGGGGIKVSHRGNAFKSTNFYNVKPANLTPFETFSSVSEDLQISGSVFTIQSEGIEPESAPELPFVDVNQTNLTFKNLSGKAIREKMQEINAGKDFPDGYPGEKTKSAACGFEYQNSRGLDSIVYGGLLK